MILENTGFNVDHWARFTEEGFICQCLKEGIYKQFGEQERIILLKEAYKIIIHDAARNAKKDQPV